MDILTDGFPVALVAGLMGRRRDVPQVFDRHARDDDCHGVVLPFDFDHAGVINTNYASPDERLPIKRVSTRLYRGFCWHNALLPQSIALFKEHRSDITDALLPPELSTSRNKRALRFIDRFYDIVDDPQGLKREILSKCRGPQTLPVAN